MAEPSLNLGNGNWAGKSDNLLAYHKANNNFYADELTFARASTGTIVNADGLIEQVPYNLVQQSNTFDTTWFNSNSTETGGQSGYDGTSDAWLINKTAASGYIRQDLPANGVLTLSVYAKKGSLNWIRVIATGGTSTPSTWFDLENGVVGAADFFTLSSSIESVGNGYYRCSITFNVGTINGVRYYPADGNNNISGTSGSIYIQDAQLDSGSTAKTYYPTTTRLNVPRVDYLNNTNGSLLLEPQRTNLITYSEALSNFSPKSGTFVDNFAISPDGTQNATKLTAINSDPYFYQSISVGSGDYTISVYVKGIGNTIGKEFLLVLGTGVTSTLQTITGEWKRFTFSGTLSAGTGIRGFEIPNPAVAGDELLVWGAQLEAGSYATSYIPTSGTTVTRNLDTFYNDNLANVIGQTEGTFYLETVPLNSLTSYTERVVQFESSGSDFMTIQRSANSTITFYGTDGVNSWSIVQTGLFVGGETIKIAGAYKDNDIALYVNGVQIGTNTSANAPQTQKLRFANNPSGSLGYIGSHQEFQLYKTRLTNAELATLTTI